MVVPQTQTYNDRCSLLCVVRYMSPRGSSVGSQKRFWRCLLHGARSLRATCRRAILFPMASIYLLFFFLCISIMSFICSPFFDYDRTNINCSVTARLSVAYVFFLPRFVRNALSKFLPSRTPPGTVRTIKTSTKPFSARI